MSSLILTYAAVGILLALVSLPLIGNKVRPNLFYGFRTPANPKQPGDLVRSQPLCRDSIIRCRNLYRTPGSLAGADPRCLTFFPIPRSVHSQSSSF